LKRDAKEGKRI